MHDKNYHMQSQSKKQPNKKISIFITKTISLKHKEFIWESPGGPVVRIQCFHWQGPGVNP